MKLTEIYLLVLVNCLPTTLSGLPHGKNYSYLPEVNMNVSQVIEYYGYPCEVHEVLTNDGYILTLQRIPYGIKRKTYGEAVFLQHGIIDSAATWVMNSPNESLAFILADAGYDVWLGNSRGNTYSRKHLNLTTKDDKFWDFSFDEMAAYDLPACIHYILKNTGQADIFYVGHSQGTTVAFAEFGRNPSLAKRIKVFFALAPVATVSHMKGFLKLLAKATPEIKYISDLTGIKEFLPSHSFVTHLAHKLCGAVYMSEILCSNILFLIAGFDRKNFNETRLPLYLSKVPAGTSVKDILHFGQMAKNGKFRMYDYGEAGNMLHYHQNSPPEYNIHSVDVPVALYGGGMDWIADMSDISNSLKTFLPKLISYKEFPSWNHMDFVWGIDANRLLYDDIIRVMNKYIFYPFK